MRDASIITSNTYIYVYNTCRTGSCELLDHPMNIKFVQVQARLELELSSVPKPVENRRVLAWTINVASIIIIIQVPQKS